jgi:choline kinase
MKAIILAAGASRRLMPITDRVPKCLLKIGDKSLIEQQLDAIDIAGIREAVIVVGYLKEMVVDRIGGKYKGIRRITYVENPDFASTNTVYSLFLAREHFLGDDFVYFNADVLFHKDIVRLLVEHDGSNVLAVDFKKCGKEEVKFVTDPGRRVVKLSKTVPLDEAEGEFIGIAKFGKTITGAFAAALERYSSGSDRNLFFERAVEDILDRDSFMFLDVSRIPNIEIDFPEDLKKAREEIYPAILAYDRSEKKDS